MYYLNNNDIRNFNKYGFFLKKKLFDKKEILKLQKSIKRIQKNKNNSNNIFKYYERSVVNKKKILVRAENFYNKDKILTNLIKNKKLSLFLKKLFKGKPILFKEKINFKPSGCRADLLHQDSQAGWNKYSKKFVNVLVSIEKSDKKNGCLQFDISGNNCFKLVKKDMSPLKTRELINPKFKNFELSEGDTIFFNSYIPHKSKSNKSKRSRNQIYLTYNASSRGNFRKKYIEEKRKSFPPEHERIKGLKYTYKV